MSINNFQQSGIEGLKSIIDESPSSAITHGRDTEQQPFDTSTRESIELNEFSKKYDTWLGRDQLAVAMLGARFPINDYTEAYGYGGMSLRNVGEESRKFELTIGSTPANNVMLNKGTISKTHAKFAIDVNGDFMVGDLGSTNGTFVNGEMLVPRVGKHLQSGDIVQVGKGPDAAAFIVLDFNDSGGEGIRRRAVVRLPKLDAENTGLRNVINNIQSLRIDPRRSAEFYKLQLRLYVAAGKYEKALRLPRKG